MNEVRNLPIICVFLHSYYRYYVPLRLPPIRNTLSPSLYAFFYLLVMGRVSPVPNHTFHTYRFPYTEGFFRAAFPASSHVPWFSLIMPGLNFPLFSFETFLTIRQNSLNVTVCMIAGTFYQSYFIHSLSTLHYCNAPSLATRLTGNYRDRTYTGKCGPASLDAHTMKRDTKTFIFRIPAITIPYMLLDLLVLRLSSPRNKDSDLLHYSILLAHLNILQSVPVPQNPQLQVVHL